MTRVKSEIPSFLQAEMADDAIKFDEEAEVAFELTSGNLAEKAQEMQAVKEQIDELEGQAKQLKDRYKQLRQQEIPDLMQALGMMNSAGKGSFTFQGGRVHIETKVYSSVRKDDIESFHDWLRHNGATDLIKEAVNAQTLSAFVRERREEGLTDPPYIVTYEERVARITKAKG